MTGLPVMMSSCQPDSPKETKEPQPQIEINATALSPSPKTKEKVPLFEKIAPSASKLNFTNHLNPSHPLARLYFSGFAGSSVTMGDFNGDSHQDLFFTGGAGPNALFLQKGNSLEFEDVSDKSGIAGGDAWASGSAAVDLDQDGDLDLIVANYDSPPHLFLNNGMGIFTDQAANCGLTRSEPYMMPTFSDYDRDGDLDLFFVTNQFFRKGGRPPTPPVERNADGKYRVKDNFAKYYRIRSKSNGQTVLDDCGRPDLLLRNDTKPGDPHLTFTDVTQSAGLPQSGFGLSATWFDFNNDGWPDLHVGNDFSDPDRLYLNRRDGTFQDIATGAFPTCAWFSMGADAADLNNDGLDDLFCADMAFTTHYKQKVGMGQMGASQDLLQGIVPLQLMRNHLFLNTGTGRFQEAAQLAGLGKSDWTWAVKFQDLDLDGSPDLFVTNGACRSFNHSDLPGATPERLIGQNKWDLWKDTPPRPETNLAFRNLGNLKFKDHSKSWGLDENSVAHGMACGDLDGDGDPDLVVTNVDSSVSLFRNNSTSPRLVLELDAPVIEGTRIELSSHQKTQTLSVRSAGGYFTTSTPSLIFATSVESEAHVSWPDGSSQKITSLKPGFRYRISKTSSHHSPEPHPDPLFAKVQLLEGVSHLEALFDDFAKQPLLPHKLSQLGPASAWGDIDGDGDPDHFLGGSGGSPGKLFRNDHGKLTLLPLPAFEKDRDCEDAAAAFFDHDQDGDLDLYVASGSYEHNPDENSLFDRLYLNDGKGNFSRLDILPRLHDVGSVVRPIDLDDDGTLEIFIGSRVVPGSYPLSTPSRLLKFKDGSYHDVHPEIIPDLSTPTMVTDAVWADVNGDQLPDLLTVSEWSSPRLFLNKNGRFSEATADSGLNNLTGWWTRTSTADLDNDGDLDFVLGNFGLNTKYHASPKKPALLYYGDFQGNGINRLVEAEYENDTLFPVRGKSCSTAAMPALANKFKTYHSFALAELTEIYSLKEASRFDCTTLESGCLINDGSGRFTFKPLPPLTQLAPVQGIVLEDVTGDALPDILLSQNFYNPQFETGPYSGGLGLLLSNQGDGTFIEVHPRDSGILLPGDPRNLHLIDLDGDSLKDLICPLNNGPSLWQRRLQRTLTTTQ